MTLKYWKHSWLTSWWFLFLVYQAEFPSHCLFSHAEKAPNFSFIEEATSAPENSTYDYIIIGGGTAGCPLAASLSEKANVLVLERGGSPYANTTKIRIENFISTLTDTSPDSFSQAFVSDDGVPNNRARVLGGGTVINVGFYSRAEPRFIKQNGLDEALVEDSYEWVERKLVFRPALLQWQTAVKNGLIEAGVLPYNGFTYDYIIGTNIGGTILDRNGNRHTAADLLEYADPKRIKVYLHAVVNKIIFTTEGGSRPKAQGVIYYDARGGRHMAFLRNDDSRSEIIVAAGAIGSPQLLMLSGIGPASRLQPLGIEVVLNQPMVGQGMADNPSNGLVIPSPRPIELALATTVGITKSGSYIESTCGYNFNALYGSGSSSSSSPRAQIDHANDFTTIFDKTKESTTAFQEARANSITNLGNILETITGPISKGYLELQNTNPNDNPKVRFNYYQALDDLRRCVQGMQKIINVVNSKSFSTFRYRNTTTQDLLNMALNQKPNHRNETVVSLEQFCRDTVNTIWHYHGGCQVGRVVDRDYRVLGVESLRVIDASTFNFTPGTNPQATIMMLGRYMGRRILQNRQ